MNLQVQASRSCSHSTPSVPSSICFKKRYVPEDINEEKISSRRSALLLQEQAQKTEKALQFENEDKQEIPAAQSSGFDLVFFTQITRPSDDEMDSLDYSVSQGDSSSVLSEISSASGRKKKAWDLREFSVPVKNYCHHSLTITVYDQQHRAGDTVWFRVSTNGEAGYKEYEDTEILDHIEEVIEQDSQFSFYLRTKYGKRDFESNLFGPDLILFALKSILRRARRRDGIVIPDVSASLLKPALTQKRKEKVQKKQHAQQEQPCFLSWLLMGLPGGSDRHSAFIGLS